MVDGRGRRPDRGFDVALFVGYHARAGHPSGTIAHTYSGARSDPARRPAGRRDGINAVVLGAWGVPVGLVTGDDALAEEIAEWLPWAERVVVKGGISRNAAASVHPLVARDRVRAGAERAVRRAIAGELQLLDVGPPVASRPTTGTRGEADHAAIVPGAERFGDTRRAFRRRTPPTAYRGFLAGLRLAGLVG